ncbi:MAG: hypothetical protein M1840_004696 [Geoglossum simile]|nr:MAG: hypothetical protein M1840_004696 [Geoglossum simile]
MRVAFTISRWIDVNCPWGLTIEQSLSINKVPQIQAMIQSRAKLKQRLERRGEAKAQVRYALVKKVQKVYDQDQPVKEVEQQLSGARAKKDPKITSYFTDKTIMLAQPGTTYEEELRQRITLLTRSLYRKFPERGNGRKTTGVVPLA